MPLDYNTAPVTLGTNLTESDQDELFSDLALVGPRQVLVISALDVQSKIAITPNVKAEEDFLRVLLVGTEVTDVSPGDYVFVDRFTMPTFVWIRGKYQIASFDMGSVVIKLVDRDLFKKNEAYMEEFPFPQEPPQMPRVNPVYSPGNNFGLPH